MVEHAFERGSRVLALHGSDPRRRTSEPLRRTMPHAGIDAQRAVPLRIGERLREIEAGAEVRMKFKLGVGSTRAGLHGNRRAIAPSIGDRRRLERECSSKAAGTLMHKSDGDVVDRPARQVLDLKDGATEECGQRGGIGENRFDHDLRDRLRWTDRVGKEFGKCGFGAQRACERMTEGVERGVARGELLFGHVTPRRKMRDILHRKPSHGGFRFHTLGEPLPGAIRFGEFAGGAIAMERLAQLFHRVELRLRNGGIDGDVDATRAERVLLESREHLREEEHARSDGEACEGEGKDAPTRAPSSEQQCVARGGRSTALLACVWKRHGARELMTTAPATDGIALATTAQRDAEEDERNHQQRAAHDEGEAGEPVGDEKNESRHRGIGLG